MKHRIQLGTASVILILTILCLAVFSLLSLSGGISALAAAKRHADAVTSYYQADKTGQMLIHHLLQEEHTLDPDPISCEIPLPAGQMLYLELNRSDQSVLASYICHQSDYEIDQNLPVWTYEE